MYPKQWNIWDFPDSIYVLLKEGVHEEFFNYVFSYFGGKRPYARFLNSTQSGVKHCWKRKSSGKREYIQYMPLWFLKKSYPFLNKDLINKLENGVEYFRVRAGNPIKINLPIIESPELYRIVAHLLADGCAGKTHVPYYANTCKELREQFKKDLDIFGKLNIYENTPNTTPCVFFPKPIANILREIFDIEFTRPNRLPKLIFNSSEECKSAFLQALFDDEGTVSTNISIIMKDKRIIEQIKGLINILGVKTNNITGRNIFSFSIQSKYIEKFNRIIGFSHPNKISRLRSVLNAQSRNKIQRTRPLNWTRDEIIKLLNRKPMGTFELSENLSLSIGGLYHHLRYLECNNKIVRSGFRNKSIWEAKV